ncbi:formate dehydrogenase subunit gamma [Melioribacteraceae bacterium 4301-Me]|uniref:formate dehydrogenase subunit gamma n=1 Tax=Pyranulibacter aquaticus TaxID=3163344 RepID=UPI00359B210A
MNDQNFLENNIQGKYYERFDAFSRFLHLLVIISFLSLAITGMVIKFSGVSVFQFISKILGGYEVTGFIHRVAALITFFYFFMHIGYLIKKKKKRKQKIKDLLKGESSLMFNKRDLIEFYQTMKWFFGIGKRPAYGRWTYWEKFDYFAVFWGVAVIGSSGLFLWFPEFFTKLGFPGWFINIATIIHSDEALLAVGFIFTVHFFNTHFRPDKFPMDRVIFTGKVSLEELKKDRPREFELIMNEDKYKTKINNVPPSSALDKAAKIFGFIALFIGLTIIVLILYSMIFVYK